MNQAPATVVRLHVRLRARPSDPKASDKLYAMWRRERSA